jgi:hypothetical protein
VNDKLNRLSWAVAAFGGLAIVLGAKLLGQILLGIAIAIAIGVHMTRAKSGS